MNCNLKTIDLPEYLDECGNQRTGVFKRIKIEGTSYYENGHYMGQVIEFGENYFVVRYENTGNRFLDGTERKISFLRALNDNPHTKPENSEQ